MRLGRTDRGRGWLAADGAIRKALRKVPQTAVVGGLPPRLLGYRWVARETVPEYFARRAAAHGCEDGTELYQTLQPAEVVHNPLPINVTSRDELPTDRGWWGFSFYDVPERPSGETFLARLTNCRLSFYRNDANDFHVGILGADDRALRLREIEFRPGHARALRESGPAARIERATWILERSFDNYSHWVTAHLAKLCLLRERGELSDLVLPPAPSGIVAASLDRLGINARNHPTFDPSRPLEVGELTLVGIDRFRPEPLRAVRAALARPDEARRRIYISRENSTRRRLVDEGRIRPILAAAGFEIIRMEALTFDEQVRLMGETAVLCGPHGAGLTNMMFCGPGTKIIEIADLGFPNPNFYALASALQHDYAIVRARSVGEGHPLERHLSVQCDALAEVLDEVLA